ncbi:MAG: hypothetical protein ACRDOM_08600 [Nocardioides sp.]
MWEDRLFSLFEDLEHQAEALYDAEREAELADRGRAEYQQVTWASRLMASVDRELTVEVRGIGQVVGTLQRVGTGWCLVRGAGQDWVLRTEALTSVRDASDRALPEVAWSPVARLGFGSALRRIAAEAERCLVHLDDGQRHDVVLLRVGADFVEAVPGGNRRILLPFTAIAGVQSRD